MELSEPHSFSRPERSSQTPRNSVTTFPRSDRLIVKKENLTLNRSFIVPTLIFYTFFRFIACFIIFHAMQTFVSKESPLCPFYKLIWPLNRSLDFFFAFFELAIIWREHFYGTVFVTFLRFAHFAINLKQAIQPEIPETSLLRQELSYIYSLDIVFMHLLFNYLLCYLFSRLLYTQITNRLRSKGNNSTVTPTNQNFRMPKYTPFSCFLLITLSIFFAIRLHIFTVDEGAEKALESQCVPEDRLWDRLNVNQAWATNVLIDCFTSLFELIAVPIVQSFHSTIFFLVLRFVHLAANLKQIIHPELPEDPFLREQYSSIYSPFYVYLHLLFNLLLSCLLPLFLFQLYRRKKANPTPSGINVDVETLT